MYAFYNFQKHIRKLYDLKGHIRIEHHEIFEHHENCKGRRPESQMNYMLIYDMNCTIKNIC
jgi:hypothetical protein